jgi:diacylglycerol kinase family enzyme
MSVGAMESVWNLPAAMRGTIQHPKLHDFYADRVRVVFSDAMPFHLGGDPRGYRHELVFALSEHPVTFIGRA